MNINKFKRSLATVIVAGIVALPSVVVHAAALKAFPTPEAAMDAFGTAVIDNDETAKQAIFGKDYQAVIPPIGADIRYRFLEYWAKSHKVELDGDAKARIAVGDSGWTFPIPLVKTKAGWQFDMKAGVAEMQLRQIGRNELAAIKIAQAYADAQKEYAQKDRNGDGVLEYANRIRSSPGKTDGLYWTTKPGAEESPLGPQMARAAAERGLDQHGSYHGYRNRILTAQGPDAPGGARNYIVDGRMTDGFGLILWPARYGQTGIMTFMINQDGQVYEKNLGPDTATLAARVKTFNPDATWRKVVDNE